MDKEVRDEFDKLHGRMNAMDRRMTVVETDLPYIRRGVEKIEGSISWATRVIAGAILIAVVAFMIRGGFIPPV